MVESLSCTACVRIASLNQVYNHQRHITPHAGITTSQNPAEWALNLTPPEIQRILFYPSDSIELHLNKRLHQTEIRRKLEEFSRKDRVNKIKLSSSRPNTAPEKSQRLVRLKPLNRTSSPTSTKRSVSHFWKQNETSNRDPPISCRMNRDVMKPVTLTDFSSSVSPYRLPVIHHLAPAPPHRRKDSERNGTLRGRRLQPRAVPGDPPDIREGAVQRAWSRSVVWVKMVYFGKSVNLSHDLMELRDEVKVFQQHCGGENLCVYKGRLTEGEPFQFVSRRHRGFPFSLTFYLNGLQVERLSSCCEFKHRKSSRLGGRHAHFGFCGVEGAAPCYRCIIAMGLDKKPTPPKRSRNDPLVSKSWETEKAKEKHSPTESSQSHDTETKKKNNQEHQLKNDYEEDFEADNEGSTNNEVEKEIVTSPVSREEDERRNDTNGNEHMNRDSEEVRRTSSISTGLSSNSSNSEEDKEDCDEEQKEEEINPKIETDTVTSERDAEEMDVPQTSSTFLLTENTPNQKMENTERKEEPREEPRGREKHLGDAGKAKETKEEHGEDHNIEKDLRAKTAVDKEKGRVKSVQEKFAEAVLIMSECVSEPELSDSTTEEDEMVTVKMQLLAPETDAGSHMDQNGAKHLQEAKTEEAHPEKLQEELIKETQASPEPETEPEREENDEDDKQKNKDEQHEDQKPELKQDTTDGEDGEKEENQLNKKLIEKTEEETTSQNSATASETTATTEEEEAGMMKITELQPEKPRRTSETIDHNTELEEKLSAGEEGFAEDQVTGEARADEEKTHDEESRNVSNSAEETENDITECAEEGNIEDGELESKVSYMNEEKDKAEKSKEKVEEHETDVGNELREERGRFETDMRDVMKEDKYHVHQSTEVEITEEQLTDKRVDQKGAPSTFQRSEETAEKDEGQKEDKHKVEHIEKQDSEQKDKQKAASERKETEEQKQQEELKKNDILEDSEVEENKQGHVSKDEDGEADTVMQKIELEQNTDNREREEEDLNSTEHEVPHENTDGPEETTGGIKTQEEIISVDQEEFQTEKTARAGEEVRSSHESNKEEFNLDIKGERVKIEEMDDEEKDKEKQEAGDDEFKQKLIKQQETNKEDDKQKYKVGIIKNSNKAATQIDASSDTEARAEDPAAPESESRNQNVQQESRGEEESEGGDGNHFQLSPAIENHKSVDAVEESRNEEEGYSCPSEESQRLEKVLLVKREEKEEELIVAPHTDHGELVSNWVHLHQASNYFETFIDPLDDMKIHNREKSRNSEALETNQTRKINEPEELESTMEERFLETEGLGVKDQRSQSSRNLSEVQQQRQMDSEQTPEVQRNVAENKLLNISAASLMKIEISQDI
ncbi:Glutamate-rich protein 3 [Bagarius yarrelli]|uniref:Glutamate-rich protein 3 n=1 Tax=Bagarius yarrelli TaxID=175774 RepID=A0A556VUQ0_BAGYA|nr:Glutamate-rich protein 3 [Bagarius yarrelli]